MRSGKSWWSLPPQLVAESRVMVQAAVSVRGATVKAQVRSSAQNLGIDYWTAWNAWNGKIGGRAFPKLLAAYNRWISTQANKELEALRVRIARLEQNGDLDSGLGSQSADHGRLDQARTVYRAKR